MRTFFVRSKNITRFSISINCFFFVFFVLLCVVDFRFSFFDKDYNRFIILITISFLYFKFFDMMKRNLCATIKFFFSFFFFQVIRK